jgi:plasmid stabilization system protein ParE
MLTVRLLPRARKDFDISFDWYSQRSEIAALRFSAEVDAALYRIANSPERYARIDELHRACRLFKFPFRVIYRILETEILVVAVAHAKRHPNYWRGPMSS